MLKPGFFLNEDLAELRPLVRLLFAGLWTIADREGRLEDRPKRIKSALLPYDKLDVETALGELADQGFITRYEILGERYLFIPEFLKHQHPHFKEPPSIIPAPIGNEPSLVQALAEPRASLGQAPDKPYASPDVARRSRSLDPESVNGVLKEKEERDLSFVSSPKIGTGGATPTEQAQWKQALRKAGRGGV